MSIVGSYEYVYGAGNAPNRRIDFLGDGTQVWGEVSGKRQGVWTRMGSIEETQMTKEGASTSKKVQIMMEAREKGVSPEYPSDKDFNTLRYTEKVRMISKLQPTGNYRISISNDIGTNPLFETVNHLSFFDPT